MQPPSLATQPQLADQRPIEISGPNNTIVVRAQGHHRISVFRDGLELARESGGEAEASFSVAPGSYVVATDGSLQSVEAVSQPVPATPTPFGLRDMAAAPLTPTTVAPLALAADTPDRHEADGVGEIRADGTSFCTITVTGPTDADEVFLRSTGGTIMDAGGTARIRSVHLDSGRAEFRFVSEGAPKLVTVYAFTADPNLRAELPIEFI